MREWREPIFFTSAAFISIAASAMNEPTRSPARCEVLGAGKLVQGSGEAGRICEAIERAVAAAAPTARYQVQVRMISPSRLTATVQVNGKSLPVLNFAVMDGRLTEASIDHFASSIAATLSKAARP